MCGVRRLARCLDGLAKQQTAPAFETLVVCDPGIGDVGDLPERYPGVRFIENSEQSTPLQLVPKALAEASGEIILLTKDHCVPASDWVKTHVEAQRQRGRAAVGGVMRSDPQASALDWAVFFLDFFRYVEPRSSGPSDTLTVCNVSYRKSQLKAVRQVWQSIFHETAVNEALREKFGPLWLESRAVVTMRRHVRFADLLRERFAFGRSFGATRLEYVSAPMRIAYVLLSPLVLLLVLSRMLVTVIRKPRHLLPFLRSLLFLVILIGAWTLGEWLGYVTHKRPQRFALAPEAA